jgi:hypothetical protein
MEKSREEDFYHFPKWRPTTSTFFPTNFCLFRGDGFPSSLNPGNIANLHKKTRDMMPEWIEGLNLRCSTNLDVHKRLCMEWLMGNCTPAGFRFGGMICRKDNDSMTVSNYAKALPAHSLLTFSFPLALSLRSCPLTCTYTFAHSRCLHHHHHDKKSTPLILGDTNPSTLATNFHILYHPRPEIKLESRIQAGPFPYAEDVGDSIAIAEYLGKRSTVTLTLHNPKRASGRMTIGCLYSLNNNFCAGAELLTEWQQCTLKYTLALAARWVFCAFLQKYFSSLCTVNTADCSLSVCTFFKRIFY